MVFPHRGLSDQHTGHRQAEHPATGKVHVAHFELYLQAGPFISFHPRLESRQHSVRPRCGFRPCPVDANVSALLRPAVAGHWRRSVVPHGILSESIFLRPFAPRPLRRFNATMGALTPARCGSSDTRPECRAQPGQVSPLHASCLPTIPPPTTPWTPRIALSPYPSACAACSGLRHSLAGSPVHHAESSSSSCGLVVRLPLLPTPHRCGAVTVGYRPEKVYLEGTRTPPTKCARGRTSAGVPPALSSVLYAVFDPVFSTMVLKIAPAFPEFGKVIWYHGPHAGGRIMKEPMRGALRDD